MRLFTDLRSRAKQYMVAVMLVLFASVVAVVAQNGTTAVRPAPPISTAAGIGAATGIGIGAANGSGIGAATGRGIGMANGTGIGGGPRDIVILAPSATNVFKVRNRKPNPTDIKIGTGMGVNTGRAVAPADDTTTGTGEATGNGTATENSPPIEKPEPKRDYMQETDGKCFYVTNLGEKQYVAASKCKIE